MKTRRSFVLLEILIALLIVSTTAVPLFKHPFQHMKLELETLYQIELERVAQNRLAKVQEDLLRGNIDSELFFSDKNSEEPLSVEIISVILADGFQKKYEETIKVEWKKQKVSNDRMFTTLVECKIAYRKPNRSRKVLEVTTETVLQKKI